MPYPWKHIAKTILVAMLAVFAAAVVRGICHAVFHETIPYTPFYPAIVAATMYGRLTGGVIATILAALAASLWLSPFGQPLIQEPTDSIGLVLFLGVSGLVVTLCEAMHRARERAEAAAEHQKLAAERDQAARIEAEEANRLKDQFVACVSHELRTPLQAILGWAEIMAVDDSDEGCRARGLEVIQRNALAQSRLIEDLLDMSRIAAGKMRLNPRLVNPRHVIDAAIQTVSLSAQARQVSIARNYEEFPSALWVDPDRLQQIVWNLLSNAMKFSPPHSIVSITLRRDAAENAVIEVADQGQGIDAEFLPYIFERFRQADMASSRRHHGLGLGLSIVKHLVELHGGTIQAASSGRNQGTTMTISLPIIERPPHSLSPCQQPGDHLLGVRVLVVDDDDATCDLIARVLRDHHSEVVAVTSVEQAMRALERFEPDVIVSDIAMPVHDGYELLRQVKQRRGCAQSAIRAMALTALSSPEDQRRAFEAGYRLHLTKPVDSHSLTSAVAELAAG